MEHQETQPEKATRKWGKRVGIITFLFFLGKGLVWLGMFIAGAYYLSAN